MSSDCTYVTLSVLAAQAKEAEQFFDVARDCETVDAWQRFVLYTFPDVKNGDLDFLNALEAAGIAYDSEWEEGQEYGPGCQTCRFTTEGECIVKEIYDSELAIPIGYLMNSIDNFEELRQKIVAKHEEARVLPWDNQIEYGKLYRTHQLITT